MFNPLSLNVFNVHAQQRTGCYALVESAELISVLHTVVLNTSVLPSSRRNIKNNLLTDKSADNLKS